MDSRRPIKTKTKRSLTRSFVVTVAVGIPGALLATALGCGTAKPDNAAGPGVAPTGPGASNKCDTEGAQQPCHVNLGTTGGGQFQACFSGTATCTGGVWSGCGGDGTVTNTLRNPGLNLAPASAPGGKTGIHPLGGGSVACGNGICGAVNLCVGGGDDGKICLVVSGASAECAGAKPCVLQKTCVGGSDVGDVCTKASDCGGGGMCTGATEDCATCPQDCGPCAPGAADAAAPVCTSDPCNPGCLGWSQPVPISSVSGVGGTIIGVSGFGQINNGQIKKLLLDNANTGLKCDAFGAARPAGDQWPSSNYNCQVDTYCSMIQLGGDGNCHQFPSGGLQGTDTKGMGTVAGMDVTIGPGCSDNESDKYRYFPVCNRGVTPIPAGTVIKVRYINPNDPFAPCPIGPAFDCSLLVGDAVSKNGSTATSGLPLAPGTCQLLDTEEAGRGPLGAACTQPNGDKWMFINSDGAVAEGDILMRAGASPVGVTLPPDSEPTTPPGTLGCANNWTDHSSNNNPPSCGVLGQNVVTFASDYHAICPVGFGPVWNKLIYDSTCPKNGSGTSEVFFEAATAPDVSGVPGVYSSFYEIAEAQKNNGGASYVVNGVTLGRDPEKCSFTLPFAQSPLYGWATCTGPGAPNCCPKDFEEQFKRVTPVVTFPFEGAGPASGAILARNDWMRLRVSVKSTPDSKANATINSWSVSYQCIARE